ncbi:diguanylate cyclase [bacterium]|jgi:diguanylate cyclase (GGDEF)-like protein|nr:diguanylate cyclase [bacterium]
MAEQKDFPEIDGLKILRRIGEGRQSEVFEGVFDSKPVAAKLQKIQDASLATSRVHILREAAYLSILHGPGIPEIYDVGESQGRTYILQELLSGRSLGHTLELGPLEVKDTLSIAVQLARVLDRVHKKNLVHRDIKPRNVIYDTHGKASLIDFGLAVRSLNTDSDEEVAGTFLYASPEQGGGIERSVDHRSDLYSFGVLLYECCTGQVPFVGNSIPELIRRHTLERPVPPIQKNPKTPAALNDIILKLLEKDPDNRFSSAWALLKEIKTRFPEVLDSQDADAEEDPFSDSASKESKLVGRNDFLAQLRKDLESALAGSGCISLVSGPSGAGKTRLIREILYQAQKEGALLLSSKCAQNGTPLPFAPLREAIENLLSRGKKLSAERSVEFYKKVREAVENDAQVLKGFTRTLTEICGKPGEETELAKISPDQFYGVLSQFLSKLPQVLGPLVLFIDDIQWIDEGSLKVLRILKNSLSELKFLVICSCRKDGSSQSSLDMLKRELGDKVSSDISLSPFTRADSALMIQELLGIRPVGPEIVDQIYSRSAGLPFAINEYVRTFLEAGLLFPVQGRWNLDSVGLSKVAVSSNAIDIVLERSKQLTPSAKSFLSMAALWGPRFPASIIGNSLGFENRQLLRVIDEVRNASLIESTEEEYEIDFIHDKVQEAFATYLSEEETRNGHLAIAKSIEEAPHGTEQYVYELADHYRLGGEDDPYRTIATCIRAAKRAIADFAPEEAFNYFETGFDLSKKLGIKLDAHVVRSRAEVCAQVGKYDEALTLFHQLLNELKDPIEKARVHNRLARIHAFHREIGKSWTHVREGLRALGVWKYQNPVLFWIQVIFDTVKGLVSDFLRTSPSRNSEKRRKYEVTAELSEVGGVTAYHLNDAFKFIAVVGPSIYPAVRMGDSKELAIAYAAFSAGLGVVGLKGLSLYYIRKSAAVAQRMGDPFLATRVRLLNIYILQFGNEWAKARAMAHDLISHQLRYLEGNDIMNATFGGMSNMTILSGHQQEGLMAMEKAVDYLNRVDASKRLGQSHTFLSTLVQIYASLGRVAEAQNMFEPMKTYVESKPEDICGAIGYYGSILGYYCEVGETGSAVDQAIESGLKKTGSLSFLCMPHFKYFYVFAAYARLEQYLSAKSEEEQALALKNLKTQLRFLKSSGLLPSWNAVRAHAFIIEAAIFRIRKNWRQSEKSLARAMKQSSSQDLPLVLYEVLLQQAHLAKDQGLLESAQTLARSASFLAQGYGWKLKAQKVSKYFKFQAGHFSGSLVQNRSYLNTSMIPVVDGRRDEQLKSLIQICTNSVGLTGVEDQSRLLLDHVIKFFGADRGFVFTKQAQSAESQFLVGRTNGQVDVSLAGNFSKKALEKSYNNKNPLILNIGENSVESESDSVILNNLRSILVAPMMHRDHILGAIYLDNRAVRGLFQEMDKVYIAAAAGILAASLESNRAAQLEIEKTALAERERISTELAFTDPLTSLRNRRYFTERMKESISHSNRYKSSFVLAIVDIDFFKKINDQYGHDIGDLVLIQLAATLKASVRPTDIICRLGGEEFAIIFSELELANADLAMKRVYEQIAAQSFGNEANPLKVTVSAGLVGCMGGDGPAFDELYKGADELLYQAKHNGRNQYRIEPYRKKAA